MSAIPIQETESVLAELPQPKGPGARLKAARKSKDIGLDTVAAQLHLRRDMLIALEEDDYDHLPARVFIVGYMRNYARYIGLPAEAIIQSLDQFLPPDDKGQPSLPKVGSDTGEVFKPSAKASKSPFSLIILAAAVAAFFIWKEGYFENVLHQSPAFTGDVKPEISRNAIKPSIALPSQQSTNEVLVPEDVETVEAPLNIVASEAVVSEQVPPEVVPVVIVEKLEETMSASPEPVKAEEPVKEAAPVVVENVNPVVSDNPGVVLKLTGKSWIEVRDSTGTFKLNNLYNAGTEKTFGGQPPYKVLIGNAAEARLMINGVAFDLEKHSDANVARFTLDPSAL
jgi:cytoskeleton protein RodZ